jgi:two-component system response regulator QseB
VQLSEREARLLRLLASRPTRVFSREELRRRVFTDADSENVVDVYVHYLRGKLGWDAVRTVRGVGFQLGRR